MFFLEFSCFFYDPTVIGHLISGSSVFSKPSLNIWKFYVHVLLKSSLENFEHCFANVRWVQLCISLNILWHWPFFGIGMKTDLFQSCDHCWVFQIYWHIECSTLTVSSFWTWNSSTGIPSPPLALFVVMLSKAHLTSYSRMSGSRWVITPLWLSGLYNPDIVFLYSSLYFCHLFLISSALLGPYCFCPLLCPSSHEKFPWYL